MRKKVIFFLIPLLLAACGMGEVTLQQLIDTDFANKQLRVVEESLKIKPIRIYGNENKSYEYEIQKCNVTLYADSNQNIIGYRFPISEKCPFKMQLGLSKQKFDSKKTTLSKIIGDAPACDHLIFSNACIGMCGNAYDPENYNYLEIDGAHACSFEYFKYQFTETSGIKSWKNFVREDLVAYSISSTGEYDDFWVKNSQKYGELAKNLWEDRLPISITNMRSLP